MNQIIPKSSLGEALAKVEQIESLVEAGWQIDKAATHVLGEIEELPIDKGAGLIDALDRYLAVFHAFEMKEQFIDDHTKKLRQRKTSVRNAFDRFKTRVRYFMAQHPEIDFRGTEQGFRLKKPGGVAKLKLKFDTYNMSDLVTEETVQEFKLPDDCYKTMTVLKLDKEKVRDHMRGNYDREGVPPCIIDGNIIEGSSSFGSLERELKLKVE